jgi:hypothetical protein
MSSNINPNNIDTAYPVAGQDNDSQGFRDNFTNIKTNFEFAADEIDDLQSKVVLKAALTGTTLDNDMGGSVIKNAKLQGTRYTRIAPTDTTGTINIDIAAGSYYKIGQLTGNVSLNFPSAGIPSAGNYAEWTVQFTQGGTPYTVTIPAAVSVGNTWLQGCNANNVVTYNKAGTYSLKFSTSDGGSTIAVEDLSRNTDPIYLPSLETLTSNISLSLATTTSIVNKSGSWAGNIANGYTGQTKLVICGNATPTTQVLTVASAGWKNAAAGNVTFTGQGQSATLTYIGGTWYCTSTGPDVTDAYPVLA